MSKLTILGAITFGVLLCALNPTQAAADIDKRERAQNWANVQRNIKDPEIVTETVEAIKSMNGMLDHDMALDLLKYFDECDMVWDAFVGEKEAPKESKKRPVDAYKIANAILVCIREMSEPEEVAKFEKQVNEREDFGLRPRMAMLDALANNADAEACLKILTDIARDEGQTMDTDMRILAIIALGKRDMTQDLYNVLLAALRHNSWRIRDAAVEALIDAVSFNEDQTILALINALAAETGKMRKVLADALKKITRVDNGTDPDKWIDWFKNKKREEQGLPPKSGKGDRGTRVKVFETETFSDRYVFVIDTSVSMTEKITEEEKEKLKKSITSEPGVEKDPRRPLDWSKINCKLDLAREEMIRSLEVMDAERTTFTIISFADDVKYWKEELVPTDEKHVAEAADWLRAIKGQKRTNVFGAMDAAYDLSEELAGVDVGKRKKPKKNDKEKGPISGRHPDEALPDTIFLYTDGYATWGKYSGNDQAWAGKSNEEKARLYAPIMVDMVAEIKDRNRIARITVNCVGVGVRQDNTTLRNLARACGGEYVAIGR
ncbi:MAG: hypothetical protein K8I27_05595 [Planctomycetes bacterium]|nr:hypothetical protein [Planctomycetota bacterium]